MNKKGFEKSGPGAFRKMWRVYTTFLTGILIGLFYSIIVSEQFDPFPQIIEKRVFVLAFSGILGGVIYTIMADGHVELPRFKETGNSFEAGLFGDIIIGISGAFIIDFLMSSVGASGDNASYVALAAKGIVGGYGGKALLDLAFEKLLKRVDKLESEREAAQKQLKQLNQLLVKLNEQIHQGLSNTELESLKRSIQQASPQERERVFQIVKEFRTMSSRSNEFRQKTQRTIPVFEALIESEFGNQRYHAQLAYACKDSVQPNLGRALDHLNQAISLRGQQLQGQTWKYELNRAAIQILKNYDSQGDFIPKSPEQQETIQSFILQDLLVVDSIFGLANVLQEARKTHISTPIPDWLRRHQQWLESRVDTQQLLENLGDILHHRKTETGKPEPDVAPVTPSLPDVSMQPDQGEGELPLLPIEEVKEILQRKVKGDILIRNLPPDIRLALQNGLISLGFLHQQSNDAVLLMRAWKDFKDSHFQDAPESIGPGSVGFLLEELELEELEEFEDDKEPETDSSVGEFSPVFSSELDRWNISLDQAQVDAAIVPTSYDKAEEDLLRVKELAHRFYHAGKKNDVPPAILAAIASRESRCNLAVNNEGYFGVMQIDARNVTPAGFWGRPDSQVHINEAAEIFANYLQELSRKYPRWLDGQVFRGAIAAYEYGVINVDSRLNDSYVHDVIARAQFFNDNCFNTASGKALAKVSTQPLVLDKGFKRERIGEHTLALEPETKTIHLKIDRTTFFKEYKTIFRPTNITQGKVDTFDAIFDYWDNSQYTDLRWLAYAMATVYHETGGRMIPVREGFAKSDEAAIKAVEKLYRQRRINSNYAHLHANGKSYFGRGLVQITHGYNYKKLGQALGLGMQLYNEPSLALDKDISVKLLFEGMVDGLYRPGNKLSTYFNQDQEDWYGAREIINGDKNYQPRWADGKSIGQLVSDDGQKFYQCCKASALTPSFIKPVANNFVGQNSKEWIEAVRETWLKKSTNPIERIPSEQKKRCSPGTKYEVESYQQAGTDHYLVKLAYGAGDWFIFDSESEDNWDITWENDHGEAGESGSSEAEENLERIRLEVIEKQPIGDKLTKDMPYNTLITPHITYGELTKHQEARRFIHNYQCKTAHELCLFLEKCREHFENRPLIITSGHRPKKINKQQGGASESEHLYDYPSKGAIDFYIKGVSLYEVQNWCLNEYRFSVGKGAHKGFVHIGIRPDKKQHRWNY